jgi:hypothetical protein
MRASATQVITLEDAEYECAYAIWLAMDGVARPMTNALRMAILIIENDRMTKEAPPKETL